MFWHVQSGIMSMRLLHQTNSSCIPLLASCCHCFRYRSLLLSLQSCAGIILSLLPLPMSHIVIATVIDVIIMSVAFSTEVFCAELLCQSHAGSSTCYTLRLPPASEVLVFTCVLQSWHTCFKLTLWQHTLSQSTAITHI